MNPAIRTVLHGWSICALAATTLLAIEKRALAFPEPQQPTGISVEYVEPKIEAHKKIYERLRQRHVLEDYKEFLSPLKLNVLLTIRTQDCNQPNAWYSSSNLTITYCYNYLKFVEEIIAKYDALPGFQKEDALVAAFVEVMLHETGHAIFDLLKVPIFGREEDAADAIASFVMLQVGKGSARRLLAGTAHVSRAWSMSRGTQKFEDFSDEHGTDAQRFYNTLCIAHGSDEVLNTHVFDDLSELLPLQPGGGGRRPKCQREYLQVKYAFDQLVLPHVDAEAMKKVQAKEWILPTDGKEVLPPRK